LAFDLLRSSYVAPADYPSGWPSALNDYAIILYGLLHARYIMTAAGLDQMKLKYDTNKFEKCPRVLCKGMKCVPYGFCDELGRGFVTKFCPGCREAYRIEDIGSKFVDGAFFGPHWVHFFLKKFGKDVAEDACERYVPRLFGYRIERLEVTGDGVK
jgi:casein kinase II subunit beta